VFRFEKPLIELASLKTNPTRARTTLRLALLLGTASWVSCPIVFAESQAELKGVNGTYDAELPAIPAGDSIKAPLFQYVQAPASSSGTIDALAPDTTQLQLKQARFYLLDERAPPASSKNSEPSKIEEFKQKLSQIVTTELTATYNGHPLGPIAVETTMQKVLSVDALQLRQAIDPLLDDSTQLLLSQFKSGFVSVDLLRAIGIETRLDPETLSVSLEGPTKKRDSLDVSLGGRNVPEGTETAKPARVAAGLTSTFLVNENLTSDSNTALSAALSGFVNIGGIRGLNLDYGGIFTFDDGTGASRFDADRTILFLDRPEKALRFEAGTLLTPLSDLTGEGDFLGIGVTKSYRQLQPTRVLQPLGQRAFQLNRAGEVTVLVDGREVSRFDAPAGTVNLQDIPLANASNRVSVIVEDEFGRRETQNFSIASDALLLQPGLSEYSFGVGQERDRDDSGYTYIDKTIATGRFHHGFGPNLTAGAFGYVSDDLTILGTHSVFGVLNGIAEAELAYSDSGSSGGGMATSINYRWNNSPSAKRAQNLAFSLAYRDRSFVPAGSQYPTAIKIDASAFYERQLSDRLRINIAGNYSEDYASSSSSQSVSISTSYQLAGFYIGSGIRIGSTFGREDEVGAFVTLTRRLGRRSSINARYDTQNDRGSFRYRRPSRNEVGSIGWQSELSSRNDDLTVRGAVDLTGNRYRSRVSISQASEYGQLDGDTTLTTRFQTGIAFADGKFGIGRDPGRGFVMVDRHKSLSDARVEIRSRGRDGLKAHSGRLGPAIARISSAFVPMTTRVDVANAPLGYNVGEGSYYTIPGARSGVKITVGSDSYRSVVATFVVEGKPLGLAAGKLINLDTGTSQVTFTNSAGRALLSELNPGAYQLEFANTDYSFNFKIDSESEAFSNLGVIDLTTRDIR
jgi:outer membrane usher protein